MPDRLIRTQNPFLASALDSCPEAIFVKNEHFVITFANRAMLGLYHPDKRGKIIGCTTVEDFTTDEAQRFLEADKDAFITGRDERLERITDYSGQEVWLATVKTRFYDSAGAPHIFCVSKNVTEIVQSEIRLRHANEALESYANEVAHDFASPLATLSMLTQMIERDKDSKLSGSAINLIRYESSLTSQLTSRIKALLLICKSQRMGELDRGWESLPGLLEKVKMSLSALLVLSDASIVLEGENEIYCNSTLVEILLQNLIENSIKYRGIDTPHIQILCAKSGSEQLVTLMDNGHGLQSDFEQQIFETGFQINEDRPGAGMGLSICKKAAELHGGRIWSYRREGGELCICFTLGEQLPSKLEAA